MTKHERKLIIEEEAAFHGVTALKLEEPGAMDYFIRHVTHEVKKYFRRVYGCDYAGKVEREVKTYLYNVKNGAEKVKPIRILEVEPPLE